MKRVVATIRFGAQETFRNRNYLVLFFISFFVIFTLFTLIPVWTVAGNTVAIQLGIFTLRDYTVLVFLSGLYAFFISMQIYAIRQTRRVRDVGTAVGGGAGALFAGVAGTAFCASCLAPLFALFGIGFGGVAFVLQYRLYFVIAIAVFMFIAIYLTARKIRKTCDNY